MGLSFFGAIAAFTDVGQGCMTPLVPPVLCEGEKRTVTLGSGREPSWSHALMIWADLGLSVSVEPQTHPLIHGYSPSWICSQKEETSSPPTSTSISLIMSRFVMLTTPSLVLTVLTLSGSHVHTLLVLADGSRFSWCPGDEVYNRTICPPTESQSTDRFGLLHTQHWKP